MLKNRVSENSDVKSGTEVPKQPALGGSHKEKNQGEADRLSMPSKLNSGDLEATLQERVLSNSNVGRAALFDKEDALQIAGSVKRFDISQDQTRELLDALLAVQREVEGSNNTVTGSAPKSVDFEGASYSFSDKSTDSCTLSASGKPALVLIQSAKTFLVVEGAENASVESLKGVAASWAEGLQKLGM